MSRLPYFAPPDSNEFLESEEVSTVDGPADRQRVSDPVVQDHLATMIDRLDELIALGALHGEFVYTQASPSDTWEITHNMNGHPTVDVVDSGGTVQIGSVFYDSDIKLTISFSSAFSGKAYLHM